LFPNDAGDGRDADAVPLGQAPHPNGDGWEEGEL
jgi:hypothetical protein